MEKKALPPLLALLLAGGDLAPRQTDGRRSFSVAIPRDWAVRLHDEPDDSYLRIAPRGFDGATEHLVIGSISLADDPAVSLRDWSDSVLADVYAEASGIQKVVSADAPLGELAVRVFSFDHLADGTRCHQAITCVRAGKRGYLLSRGHVAGRDEFAFQIEEVVHSFRLETGLSA